MDSKATSANPAAESACQVYPPRPGAKISFAERQAQLKIAYTPRLVEGTNIMRAIERAPPGDPGSKPRKVASKPELSQRSQYFEDAFSVKDMVNPARDKVRREAIVLADLKTNVIVSLTSSWEFVQPNDNTGARLAMSSPW